MSRIEARMGQLVRWDARRDATFVQTLQFDLDADTAARVGSCFGIITADTKGRKGQALAAHLEDAFVRGAAEAVRKLPLDAPHDQLFEAAVSRVNHALGRLFGDFGLEIEPETVTAAVVSFNGQEVVATTWGKPTVLLYHPMPDGSAKAFDLADDGGPDPRNPRAGSNRRCFGSIIAGRMGKRDRMLLASHDIRALLGDDEVAQTVTANEPQQATDALSQLLSGHKGESVAALVLDVAEVRYFESDPNVLRPAPVPFVPAPRKAANDSIDKLLRAQHDAAQTLSPSLMSGLGKKVGAFFRADDGDDAAESPTEPPLPPEPPEPPSVSTFADEPQEQEPERRNSVLVVEILRFAWRMLRTAASLLWRGLVTVAQFGIALLRSDTRDGAVRAIQHAVRELPSRATRGFGAMPLTGKIAAFAAIALLVASQAALIAHRREQAAEESLAMRERSVDTINQKIDAAEASIIYRDENRAKALLVEASDAVRALAADTPERTTERDALLAKIAASQNALRRETPLGEAQVLASITTDAGTPSIVRIERGDGSTLWLAAANGDIYAVSAKDGKVSKAGSAPDGAAPAMFVPNGRDLLAVGNAGTGSLIAPNGSSSARTVDVGGNASATDAALYGSRLYVLDAARNRIVRHDPGTGEYGEGKPYMKDGTDLSQAVSMAIDGFVWVLRKDGSVVRIAKGSAEAFAVGVPEPAVTAAARLRTEADEDLFVLEPSAGRIIRFNKKTGALIAQYAAPALKSASDFAIDANGTVAYVTTGNQVLAFPLPEAK